MEICGRVNSCRCAKFRWPPPFSSDVKPKIAIISVSWLYNQIWWCLMVHISCFANGHDSTSLNLAEVIFNEPNPFGHGFIPERPTFSTHLRSPRHFSRNSTSLMTPNRWRTSWPKMAESSCLCAEFFSTLRSVFFPSSLVHISSRKETCLYFYLKLSSLPSVEYHFLLRIQFYDGSMSMIVENLWRRWEKEKSFARRHESKALHWALHIRCGCSVSSSKYSKEHRWDWRVYATLLPAASVSVFLLFIIHSF